jgi:hypothetical protein
MQYGDLKAQLQAIVNRSDMSDAEATQFIQMAQNRLDRWPQVDPLRYAPRPAFMEKYVSLYILEDEVAEPGAFIVPTDFLQVLSLHCGSVEAERVGIAKFLQYPSTGAGIPSVFMQTGHTIHLRPIPAPTTEVFLYYYGTAAPLVDDEDVNEWTVACPDVLLYGAAAFACDHFEDERFPRFESRFKEALLEVQDQTLNEFMSGSMRMANAYTYPDDEI